MISVLRDGNGAGWGQIRGTPYRPHFLFRNQGEKNQHRARVAPVASIIQPLMMWVP